MTHIVLTFVSLALLRLSSRANGTASAIRDYSDATSVLWLCDCSGQSLTAITSSGYTQERPHAVVLPTRLIRRLGCYGR